MVSDEHKRRVLAHLEAQVPTEKPLVLFSAEVMIDPNEVERQDGGMAVILEVGMSDGDSGMFIRIQSWDDQGDHSEIQRLIGRKIEVIVRTID